MLRLRYGLRDLQERSFREVGAAIQVCDAPVLRSCACKAVCKALACLGGRIAAQLALHLLLRDAAAGQRAHAYACLCCRPFACHNSHNLAPLLCR